MVKLSCKVKLVKYKANKSAYPAVMNAGGVQSMLRNKANSVCSAANGSARPGAVYGINTFQGKLARGYVATTTNYEAMIDEFYHKTLTKAAHSAGGE